MVQIYNITQVRNQLGFLVGQVAREKKKVVIIRDSLPEAVLIPYTEFTRQEEEKKKILKKKFDKVLKKGKEFGRKWAKNRGIDLKSLSEEELYELIDKV